MFHTPPNLDKSPSSTINPFAQLSIDSNNDDINAKNWYETQMLDYQPDITQFINNPNHDIFKYKWNSRNWLEQFQKLNGMHDERSCLNRRLLRVTVMLNTIGVVKAQGYEIDGTKIDLKAEQLSTIVYNHQSKIKQKQTISSITPPFKLTKVQVINDDCLVVYNELLSNSSSPVLLNMAHPEIPGGGYRHGFGAQEQNIIRRSNYYLSLDAELNDTNNVKHFECMPTCELKLLESNQSVYPIDDFGAIYTSGITVFRDTETNGYDYLCQPIYGMCAIAMASYEEPPLKNDNKTLTDEFAVGMQKKIENLFAIAYNNQHDSLVLSAFGCGVNGNPPEHVGAIFKSAIQQYAGYFKTIIFAITDNKNTTNPQGNYQLFKNTLDGLEFSAPTQPLQINMASGPYRIIADETFNNGQLSANDVCIFGLPPCPKSTQCSGIDDRKHTSTFSHPPLCPNYNACNQLDDQIHTTFFFHKTVSSQRYPAIWPFSRK